MEQMFDEWGAWEQFSEDDACWDRLPEGLGELSPGPELGALLASVDPSRLCGYDRVVLLRALSRQVAHDQALFLEAMLSVAEAVLEEVGEEGYDYLPDEIRAALRWTRRAAQRQLGLAWELCKRLPGVWEALRRGDIDLPKAWVISQETGHLEEEVARRVADQALERAPEQTTGQLRARLRRLCIETDPEAAKERYRAGLEERRVVLWARDDGTADLSGLCLPVDRAQAAWSRIGALARAAKGRDDPRSWDQVRADVFLDLLEGTPQHRSPAGVVDLQVDLLTLAGLSENPGVIPGWGPVLADVARQVASERRAQWRFTVTHSGEVVAAGVTRRRPTAALRRRVEATHPVCVFPGCRMPARSCDLDHRRPFSEGGATSEDNLAPGCRHDHGARHHGGWKVQRLRPGVYQWTSPLGHRYTVQARGP